jgi:RNA polymerase sigma factor (sigma-70 family)
MTDAKVLIDKILAGNPNAFTQLVRQHERLVSQIVFRIVPSRHDREDICQDVFIKVYQNLDRFEYQSKLSTWIARIAYNTALNYASRFLTTSAVRGRVWIVARANSHRPPNGPHRDRRQCASAKKSTSCRPSTGPS